MGIWDKLKALSGHPAAQTLKKLFGDPVQLYSVFLIMTGMYYYHQAWSWLYTVIALLCSAVLMRFYDFVARKKLLGPLCYAIFLVLGLYGTGMITNLGRQSYPITFLVWFLTPQGIVDFSMAYTIAIFLLMTGFLTSAVYYFAKVRYRMVMQLLIMLIPLSLYAKENLHMPALLVILLLASYFLLMVYCRQLRESTQVQHITGFSTGASVALYVAAFSIIAAVIPKPQFEADREFIDNAMSYSTWSDVLMSAISMFTDTMDNTGAASNNARTIFYVRSDEALRLRTQTYTYYLDNNSWNVVYEHDRPDQLYDPPLTYQPRALAQAILDAAAQDSTFAGKYDLTSLAGTNLPAQNARDMYIFTWFGGINAIPSPTRTIELTEGALPSLRRSETGTLILPMEQRHMTMTYYQDAYAREMTVSSLLSKLHRDTYESLLTDAAQVLRSTDPDGAELLDEVRAESEAAGSYLAETAQLDYQSAVVDELAAQITEGMTSDYEKALAIERYFTDEGYIYDLGYTAPDGTNIDYFLTEGHRGVCYEYATAMVLMCRSIGLPTRFVQGYNLSERYDTNRGARDNRQTNFVIKMRNAHAFPEVYISGYGWLSFEPTVASLDDVDATPENQTAMRWGYVLFALLVIAVGIWAMLPYIRERLFRSRLLRQTPPQAASAVFIRMRQTLRLPDSVTVQELSEQSALFYTNAELFTAMDQLLYRQTEEPMTAQQLAEQYIRWQADRTQFQKEQKRLRKEQKKSNVS